jgi:hypothetical protein
VRETLEECGLVVRLRGFVGTADELVYAGAKRGYFRKRCSFFAATMISRSTDVVPEHALSWLAPAEAVARLSDGSQRWAVSRAVSLEPGGLLPPPTGREEG